MLRRDTAGPGFLSMYSCRRGTRVHLNWGDGFAAFLRLCGFNTIHVSTLTDQELVESSAGMEDYGWAMTSELASRSTLSVAEASPDAEAIVVTGAETRNQDIVAGLESKTKRPIVAANTIIYWAIARELDLSLRPAMGSVSKLPKV